MAISVNVISGVLLSVGGLLIIAGGVLIPMFEKIIHSTILKKTTLTNGSDAYNNWAKPAVPVYMQFYVFDVVNPQEVIQNKSKPILHEVGPFTYREIRDKKDISFEDHDRLLYYRTPKSYVFEPSMSVASENYTFTTVNIAVLTITQQGQYGFIESGVIKMALARTGEGLFVNHTVKEYLWGYQEPLMVQLNNISETLSQPPPFNDTHVGLFYGPTGNGSNDGEYSVFSGVGDISKVNQINTWKGNGSLNFWNSEYCNMLNGSDGSSWHPFVNKSETLYIFSSDICRSIYVKYEFEYSLQGIDLLRFTPPDSVFADPKDNPDNLGYCTPDCLGAGVLNVSSCKGGAPIVVSSPHFYQGAKEYVDAFVGLHPEKEQHQTYLDIEPYTGTPLNVSKKLQLNAYITPNLILKDTQGFNGTIFPLLWLNESALIDPPNIRKFKQQVLKPILMTVVIQYGLIAAGAFIVICCSIFLVTRHVRAKNQFGHSKLEDASDTPSLFVNT